MKPLYTALSLPLALLALPAAAQDATIDVNGDRNYSYPELQVAMPDMTIDDFTMLDGNGDGLLDAEEIAVGVEADMLPPTEG